MDKDLVNLVKNSIMNDFCKMLCLSAIYNEDIQQEKCYIEDLIIYCIIYDMEYLVEKLYNQIERTNKNYYEDDIDFAYIFFLKQKNKENDLLKIELLKRYKDERKLKHITKEIKNMKMINYYRKSIINENQKSQNRDAKINSIILEELNIVALAMKYKVLIEELNIENNPKIDRILNWNVRMLKNYNTMDGDIPPI